MVKTRINPKKNIKKKAKSSFFRSTRGRVFTNIGLILLLLGSFSIATVGVRQFRYRENARIEREREKNAASLASAIAKSPQERTVILQELASLEESSRDRTRARYLLGIDLLAQEKPAAALSYLKGLETEYTLLAPQILLQTALAYQQNGQTELFQSTLEKLIATYPQSPFVVDALYLLEPNNPQTDRKLIERFPAHPRTQKLARKLLQENPDRFELLLLLAKYSREADVYPLRDRLVLEYPAKLTPADWETLADGYWRDGDHRKAADAYTLASSTPRNLYRAARGFHRNGNIDTAKRAYQRLLREYHDSDEAGQGLVYLASISSGDEAVVYLETAIAKFPKVAPQALLSKAVVHEAFDKNTAAELSRQKLLDEYGDTSVAGEYRWKTAKKLAARGNKYQAWEWMQPIISSTKNFDFAPKALYVSAKWAQDLGKTEDARRTWERAIALYPQSYWAWRSAVALGWDVGDFDSVRDLNPSLEISDPYIPLPMGSQALQELYFLRQYEAVWTLLQAEITRPQQLTGNEQFAEGLMLVKLGRISEGMQEILDLSKRKEPQAVAQWQAIRKTSAYWHGLFPFPYKKEILHYAKREKINPLLAISVMRKESTFDPEIDSHVGALGLMQIVPPTAEWVAEQIDLEDYSLIEPKDNIKIGTWYLAHNHHRYEDNSLLAIASYNAGTGNVNKWLDRYDINDADGFVEQIPFEETKDYVEGVFGNYWNYLRLYNPPMKDKINSHIEQTLKKKQ